MNRAERRKLQKKGITAKDLKMIEEASAFEETGIQIK